MDTAINFGRQGILSGWKAAAVAGVTGGPALLLAVAGNDTTVIFSGIATGAFFAAWGIWNFGATLILRTLHDRLKQADGMIDRLRAEKYAIAEEAARQRVLIASLEEESDERKIRREDRPK